MKVKQIYKCGLKILIMHLTILSPNPDNVMWQMQVFWDEALQTIHLFRGLWRKSKIDHINLVELQAIEIGVWTYCSNKHYSHINVMCGTMTVISYVNNMGGTKSDSSIKIVCKTWGFCITEKLWISAAHIPSICNRELSSSPRFLVMPQSDN